MTISAHTAKQPVPALAPPGRAEAARYALLRRLAPSMRHHLVVHLQPIGMIYEVMDRRLRAPAPNLAHIHDSAHKINDFARAALASCLDVVTWLAPDESAVTTVAEGVGECVGLLASSLSFSGYAVRNEVTAVPGELRRSAIRNVLTAAMIHATDKLVLSSDLVLTAEGRARGVVVMLALHPADGNKGFSSEAIYRQLDWADVEALAAAESVDLVREDSRSISLTIPWAQPAQVGSGR